ncbi:RNA polymerase sigma factor [Ekhidna sp.]
MKKIEWGSIINDLRKGHNEVLRIFFEEYSQYCMRRLTRENQCTQEDAQDIFVEAIMSLREKLLEGKLDRVMNVKSYLYKSCYHMLMERIRKKKREDSQLDDIVKFYYESQYHESVNFDPALMKITLSAWDYLTEKCKDILHFFYVDKLRMGEISELMGLASADVAKTTKSRCYKALLEKAMELKSLETIPDDR